MEKQQYKSKAHLINSMVLDGIWTEQQILDSLSKNYNDQRKTVQGHLIYLNKIKGVVIATDIDKKTIHPVDDMSKEALKQLVDKSYSRQGKIKSKDEVEQYMKEQEEKIKERNEKHDYYYRISEHDTTKVTLIEEHTTYRMIEFEEGDLKGFRRRIQPPGVPAGKKYPVLFELDKGFGKPELFSINGKARVKMKINPETAHLIPKKDPHFKFDRKIDSNIIEALNLNQTVALQGEPGSGKTSRLDQIAAHTNWPCIRINFNGNTSTEDFIGKMMFNPEKGAYFVYGKLPEGCKVGALIILDEFDFCQPEYGARLHKVFEESVGTNGNGFASRTLSIPENNGEVIDVHPETRFCATGNALFGDAKDRRGSHVGTQDIGAAFEDRFARIFEIGYLDPKSEQNILRKKVKGLKVKYRKAIVNVANQARSSFENGELMETFSTRRCLQWAKKSVFSKTLLEAAETTFLPKLRMDDKAVIKQLITMHVDEQQSE